MVTLALSLTISEIKQFFLENAHFFYTPLFNSKFENISLELHPPNFVPYILDKGLNTSVKFFLLWPIA